MLWRFLEEADERLPCLAVTKTNLSVRSVGMQLNLDGPPNNAIHVSAFSGEDGGNVKFNAVYRVDVALSYGCLVWIEAEHHPNRMNREVVSFVSASHGSLSSAPSRNLHNMTPNPTIGSIFLKATVSMAARSPAL
jgi:hypothetical protein